jgi:hypothetical protein
MATARKTRKQHLAEGTFRPDRATPNEAEYAVGEPEKPGYIAKNRLANAEWDRIVPIMLEHRTMSPAFRGMIECYCIAYAAMVAAFERGEAGLDRMREFRQCAGNLGLTPTTVAKASASPTPESTNKFLKFQKAG